MNLPATRVGEGTVLDAILARTRERVAAEKARRPLGELQAAARAAPPARPFASALARAGHGST